MRFLCAFRDQQCLLLDETIRRYKNRKVSILLILFFLCSSACAPKRTPIPPGHIPPPREVSQEDEQYGHEILGGLSEKYELDYSHPRRSEVDEIVLKIADSIGASQHPWHVHVFSDASLKNAAATKGNHIFVWTGIIDATLNEDELAAVLAHEMAHVLANHTDPSESELWTKVLIEAGSMAAAIGTTVASRGAYGSDIAGRLAASVTRELGTGIFVNPYTREKEYEADQIGLFLMAKAGYRPEAAIEFWERALYDPAFTSSIPFLATHPPAADRLARLKELILYAKEGNGNIPPPLTQSVTPYPASTSPVATPSPIQIPSTPGVQTPAAPYYPPKSNPLGSNDSFDLRKK